MPKYKSSYVESLIGKEFGKLTVIEIAEPVKNSNGHFEIRVLCKCYCGTIKEYDLKQVKIGNTKSCGCSKVTRMLEINKGHITHGFSKSLIYGVWNRMKTRCTNPNAQDWSNYGGRGIEVCEEWLNNPENFIKWALNNGYEENLELDRKNNNGMYEPENCRFVTSKTNNRNKRNTILISFNGELKPLKEWAEILNFDYQKIWYRLKIGQSFEKAIR